MFEAFRIGIILRVENLISPQLALLSEEFKKLDALTITLKESLSKISVDARGFRGLTAATDASTRAFERASVSAEIYERRLSALHRLSGTMGSGAIPRLPGGGGNGGGGGAGGFHGGNIHLGPGGVGIGTVGMAAGDWFWPLAASGAMAYAGKSLFESAKDLDTERQKFKLFGMSDAQNNEAFDFVRRMRVYGSTQTANMADFRESQGIFREAGLNGSEALAGAKLAAPILAKLDALDSSLDGESAARSRSSNMSMLRYVESVGGLKSTEEFNRLADIGYRLKVSSGDTVDWTQLQQFQKRGGSASINISGEGMARMEPSISTLGGSAVGVALATDFGRLQGIVKNLPVPVIEEFLKYGLWDRSKVELNSRGGISKFLDPNGPMSQEQSQMLSTNPELFYETYIRPIYSRMNLDSAGVIRQNALIYGRTGGALANEWEKQLGTIQRAVDAFAKTKGLNAATAQLPQSLTGQEKEFESAWTDFKTNFGTKMLPFFSGILHAGSAVLRMFPESTGGDTIDTLKAAIRGGGITGAMGLVVDRLFDAISGARKSHYDGMQLVTDPNYPGGRWIPKVGYDASAPSFFGNALNNKSGSQFVSPNNSRNIVIQSPVFLDGRKISENTASYFDRAISSPLGGSDFDSTLTTPSVLINQAR